MFPLLTQLRRILAFSLKLSYILLFIFCKLSFFLYRCLNFRFQHHGWDRQFYVVLLSPFHCYSVSSRDVQRKVGIIRVIYYTWRVRQLPFIPDFIDCEFLLLLRFPLDVKRLYFQFYNSCLFNEVLFLSLWEL